MNTLSVASEDLCKLRMLEAMQLHVQGKIDDAENAYASQQVRQHLMGRSA